jgi:ABC-2 type transport system ATP-binding protein
MIKTSGLCKSFRTRSGRHTVSVDAVKSVDLAIAEGEVFGFLGPNGAGKTTTLRMLATLIEPDGGEAIIAGADLAQRRAQAVVTAFGLAGYADRRCKTYSGGQRRRLGIALGVIHRPKVLFLDEPTAGLDPPSHVADPSVWRGLVIVVVLAAAAVAWSARLFARSLR